MVDTSCIRKICRSNPALNARFIGVFASDELRDAQLPDKYPAFLVVNNQKSTQSGEHWLMMAFTSEETLVYFDSFGMSFFAWPIIWQYIESLGGRIKRVSYNTDAVQSSKSELCALFCIYAASKLVLEGLTFRQTMEDAFVENRLLNDCKIMQYMRENFVVGATDCVSRAIRRATNQRCKCRKELSIFNPM
jgi:hypothetical protein